MGVNSDPKRRTGALLNVRINYENREKEIQKLFECLQHKKFEFYNRSRALFSIENPITMQYTNKLCLNEVFAAEKDVSSTSMYRLNVDEKDLGKFKSSGILISTGTGSSGWLYSARSISSHVIREIRNYLGDYEDNDVVF